MLDQDEGNQPPVLPPQTPDAGTTFDALSQARKRAQERRGKNEDSKE